MKRHVYIVLVLGLLGISFGAPLARFVPGLAALTIAFWRMAGASMLLWAHASLKPQGTLDQKHLGSVIVAGIFLALHFVFFYSAVKVVPIANATLFATLAPIFTLSYERFFLKRRLSVGALVGLWLAIGGAVLVQISALKFGSEEILGNLLALASSVFMAVVLIIAERMRNTYTTLQYTRWLYLFAALTLGAIGLIMGIDLGFTLPDAKWILALVILPTLIGHNSMSYAVKYLRPTIVGSMPFGEPILATILAWFLFGEMVGLSVVIGGGITLTGLTILTFKREKPKPEVF
ncbi:MAG: DMT family transporter [Candidatus Marinimicrobia bacterium]|nr:DMT family transporter [Candidatus Neomarinimicrobiota bacterium]